MLGAEELYIVIPGNIPELNRPLPPHDRPRSPMPQPVRTSSAGSCSRVSKPESETLFSHHGAACGCAEVLKIKRLQKNVAVYTLNPQTSTLNPQPSTGQRRMRWFRRLAQRTPLPSIPVHPPPPPHPRPALKDL